MAVTVERDGNVECQLIVPPRGTVQKMLDGACVTCQECRTLHGVGGGGGNNNGEVS